MAKSLQAEATCPICLDVFFNPVSLSCAHIFCWDCIQNWQLERGDSKLMCPMCRGESEKPPVEEWQIRSLALLIKQHGPLLEQSLHLSDELLKFREDMTLDADTANSFLILSNDLRSVHYRNICQRRRKNPRRFTYLACVLGTPSFSFGRHYWEVEVGEGKEWALGVCKESVNRKKRKNDLTPEHGYWVISMKAGVIHTNAILARRIPVSSGLSHVGIFLDVEMEELKFFDVRNNAFICVYTCFYTSEPLRPFFCPELPGEAGSGAPLTICS
ncbi:ret finger protein-like 4B [Tupaia chinensis]|uniref:ret finger protein-like 4B n=1 Tax=Tupaia chinensis TaxID=246437 RepID=UPI0003C91DB8|nr:ret finger protein-like 4B [Tupaia chinensis]